MVDRRPVTNARSKARLAALIILGVALLVVSQGVLGATAPKTAKASAPAKFVMTSMNVASVSVLEKPVAVRLLVRNVGDVGGDATVVLEAAPREGDFEVVGSKPVTAARPGDERAVQFSWTPSRSEAFTLRATVTPGAEGRVNVQERIVALGRLGPNQVGDIGGDVLRPGSLAFAAWSDNGCAVGDVPKFTSESWSCGEDLHSAVAEDLACTACVADEELTTVSASKVTGTLTADQLATGSVGSDELADGSVRDSDLAFSAATQAELDAEVAARIAAVQQETAARIAAIQAEAATRSAAIAALQTALTSEASTRAAADTTLSGRLDRLGQPGTLNDASNPVVWTQLRGVPAGFADGTDTDTTYTAGSGLKLTGTVTSTGNLRIMDCAANEVLKRNAGDTAWSCGTDLAGSGTVTSVAGSDGLSGTVTSSGSLSLMDCAANQILRRNAGDTAWACNDTAPKARALAANPTNCAAGQYPLGIDASGNVEGCTTAASGGSSTGPWKVGSGFVNRATAPDNYATAFTGARRYSDGDTQSLRYILLEQYNPGTNFHTLTPAPGVAGFLVDPYSVYAMSLTCVAEGYEGMAQFAGLLRGRYTDELSYPAGSFVRVAGLGSLAPASLLLSTGVSEGRDIVALQVFATETEYTALTCTMDLTASNGASGSV